ncbi:transglutaminase domain-containing protein [Hymenobacter jeollabukensis]|uniref:Transglutaminase-like domain-containing protein n=1 Tax=Hymenobacter jeollabukensis TaxID=2025313 RepID=A0A5R8WS11_9BACT|nr:transglutaminase domain-containing protein [Hymenobacter jeollabukensis]TLM93963.1 hypothetical protein FDY95_07985 [Hymenobacter jeollabukensis]
MFSRVVILATLVLLPAAAWAQQQPLPAAYQTIDARMQQVPDSAARSVGGLARYIKASFTTDDDRAWAAFDWVARQLRYDAANMYSVDYSREPADIVAQALSTRLGVGTDFAELYAALANALGLRTYVVAGFSKRPDGQLSPVPHAWCATRLSGQWYLLDPAWAAGTVAKGTFVPQLNSAYFKMPPTDFVRTHLPFDPLWQLLPAPYSLAQFQQGTAPPAPARPWASADSLAAYERLDYVGQLRAASRRARQAEQPHQLATMYQAHNRQREQEYQVTQHNRMLLDYNRAQQLTERAVERLNAFFTYYNHQFQPRKTDAQLQQLLKPIAADFQQAKAILASVQFADETRQATVRALTASVRTGETRLKNSQAFLARYLRTSPPQRDALFTTRGGPNEMTR